MMMITVTSRERTQFIDITSQIQQHIQQLTQAAGVAEGLCLLYVPHTTAAVTINESADPSVAADIQMVLNKIVPWKEKYRHLEGNSPAHVKSSLVGASELVAVENGRLVLGTWQGIFFCEFDGPRSRKLQLRFFPAKQVEAG